MTLPGRLTVTSANSLVGRELLRRLTGGRVRTTALVRADVQLPADHVVRSWTTAAETREAIATADAVVHLSGEIAARTAAGYEAANVETTRVVARSLRAGQRVVFISYLGADPASSNLFLRAKGRAEQLLLDSPADAVIFRTQVIAHPLDQPGGFEDAIRSPRPGDTVRVIGDGIAPVRPIAQSDVVDAVLAAAGRHGSQGVYDLVGEDEMSLDDVVRLYNTDDVRIAHTPSWLARPLSRVLPGLTPTFVDLFLRRPTSGDPSAAVGHFGLRLTPLSQLWSHRGEDAIT